VTDLPCHVVDYIAVLERFSRVSEFNRMRALRNWQDLASRTDAVTYSETLTWLDGKPVPCLLPAPSPRCRKEHRTLARWLTSRGKWDGPVFRLP
jgi:hypothetical protein